MSFAGRSLALESRLYTRLRARADRRLSQRAAAAGERAKPHHLLTGERGEDAAYFYLRDRGYTVVARRWRSAKLRGDLDLIAWDGDTLVAFEVKTRTARDLAPAEIGVDRDKRNQLRAQVRAYLRRLPERHRAGVPVRFDILAVYLLPGGVEFDHIPTAFSFAAPPEDLPKRF